MRGVVLPLMQHTLAGFAVARPLVPAEGFVGVTGVASRPGDSVSHRAALLSKLVPFFRPAQNSAVHHRLMGFVGFWGSRSRFLRPRWFRRSSGFHAGRVSWGTSGGAQMMAS